jgi:hypothetical protein
MGVAQVADQGLIPKMKDALKTILATNSVPTELIVTYDDMHGLWGGTTITVQGDGNLKRQTKALGAPDAEITRTQVDARKLIELIRLLFELQAWDQLIADEPPVAGESRAHLTISLKEGTTRIWERVNEMATNNRLVQIKTLLENL